ncbi:MAG: helix-turn-helix domain-containing protein [Oligoflexia bacterium]|nr:helix-turn-helix domain-containing protein [Oligoflexia bacterium]
MDIGIRISKLKETFKENLEMAQEITPKKRRYPKKFHRAIVDLLKKGVSAKIIQEEFNLSSSTIFTWKNRYVSNNDTEKNHNQSACDFIELNMSDKVQSSNTKGSRTILDSKQLVTAPPTAYTLSTPSGYQVRSLSKDDLISLIHSLECK